MDFDREHLESAGYGRYESLDPDSLTNLFIAYRTHLAEGSDVFHNNIRERWNNGDPQVLQAMEDFAGYAQEVRDLLLQGKGADIGPILDANFDRRRSIYQLSQDNIDLVDRARAAGAHCKFSGSGGAVVGTYADDDVYARLEEAFDGSETALFKPTVV